MSLFRTIPTPGDFAPLFRLLDEYDVHRSTAGSQTTSVRAFAPRFDVRETEDAYLLDGEVPGTAQKDIDIEFTEPQTLVIKGRSEREYHSKITDADNNNDQQDATESASGTMVKSSTEKQVTKSDKKLKPRYWVSERTVGEFQRTFSFPTRVDQDNVKANLKNGILSIVVPKAAAPSAKKITIH